MSSKSINGLHFIGTVTPVTAEGDFKGTSVTDTFVVLDKVKIPRQWDAAAPGSMYYLNCYLVMGKIDGVTYLIPCTELVNTKCQTLYKGKSTTYAV